MWFSPSDHARDMIRVMYLSKSNRTFASGELASMCYSFAAANARRDVTGVLLRIGNYFVQILEGERSTVAELLEKIEEDRRHVAMTILLEQEVESRVFQQWSMNLIDCDMTYYVNLPELVGLREQIEDIANTCPDQKKVFSTLILQMIAQIRSQAPRANSVAPA